RPQFLKDSPLKELKKISQIDWRHPAKAYVDKRMLPSASHHKLFYAPKFKTWVNSFIPEKFKFDKDEPRLIIPFLDEEKNCFGFQGRAFLDVGPRYITIMLDDTKPKVFGLDSVDMTKRFYITEGPIDSLFLPNAIAMAGADLNISWIDKNNRKNAVFVYDNEPRNKDIIKRMEKVIELGHNICIWPASMIQKDINDMVLAGHSAADVQRLIDKHACEGLEAKLALMMWRKV
ncbi:DNA primase, partial [bacterium]|nr:DNA primase [bacterium]